MGLEVAAEGVETADPPAFLRVAGCREMQGYYFSKAVPLDELARNPRIPPGAFPTPPLERTSSNPRSLASFWSSVLHCLQRPPVLQTGQAI